MNAIRNELARSTLNDAAIIYTHKTHSQTEITFYEKENGFVGKFILYLCYIAQKIKYLKLTSIK